MKIKKIKLITEESRKVGDVTFLNSTEDQFPYVESALNSLDNNFNWWKENWPELEELISKYLSSALSDQFENKKINVSSRFTIFHGSDEKVKDVIWTGPAVVYSFEGASLRIVKAIKNSFGGVYKGHKIFVDEDQLIFLFG
jgi:predicted unusual protein kinase regulating ubiquinone biosynthesis (AarF/ABC1/UbiB family)